MYPTKSKQGATPFALCHSLRAARSIVLLLSTILIACLATTATAKSLYVNKNLNAYSPISAYDIQPAPSYLVYQSTSGTTIYGGAGLTIDTDSAILFVTYETYGIVAIVDAVTLATLGTVTAPGAGNLAGIVVDQEKKKVYTADRQTAHLYVYDWNATTKTLTLVQNLYLPGVSQIYGLALDEVNDWLFVADNYSYTIRYFNTANWTEAGTIPVSQRPMGIAVDVKKKLVYTGNAYPGYGSLSRLVKYDMTTATETYIDIRALPGGVTSDNVVGLAVDPESSLLYITTGNQGVGGSDRIIVFNSDLTMLYATGDIGDPTGLCVPGKQISYNPLNLAKQDNVAAGECAQVGSQVTYTISYNNLGNPLAVNNASIKDTLPSEASFVSATGGGVYDSATHTVTWTLGTIPANNAGATFEIVVSVTAAATPGGSIANHAMISSTETGPTTVVEYTDICLIVNKPPTVDAGGPYTVTEGGSVTVSATGSDPDGDALNYAWDLDGDGTFETPGQSVSFSAALLDGPTSKMVQVQVTDPAGLAAVDDAQITVDNAPPVITGVTGPTTPVPVGGAANINVGYTDPCSSDTHTVSFVWDDGTTSAANGVSGAASGSHSYSSAGIYTVAITVTDDDGGSAQTTFEYVVVYDPNGGFVTGGGWIESPSGAYVSNPSLVGRANFGFVSKYQKGATTPVGQTEFQFKVADLNFHSGVYDWLVIAGSRAQYKGTGTINGAGDYGFFLVAVDGALPGGGGVDKFRIKIWDRSTDMVVYDNQPGEATDSSLATALSGGSIVIHTK